MSSDQIVRAVKDRHLHRILPAVYAVGHRNITPAGWWKAATLQVPDSLISLNSAAQNWHLRETTRFNPIHLSAPGNTRPHRLLRTQRRTLHHPDATIHNGIPTTSLARTLLDIAAYEGAESLERILREAHFRHRHKRPAQRLAELIARNPGARGTRIAREVLESRGYTHRIVSPLEDRFRHFLAARNYDDPVFNFKVVIQGRTYYLDAAWPDLLVAVELDGRDSHFDDAAHEADRERDAILLAAGWRIPRITSHRLDTAPDEIDRELRALRALAAEARI